MANRIPPSDDKIREQFNALDKVKRAYIALDQFSNMSAEATALWHYLACRRSNETGTAWPPYRDLMRRFGWSKPTLDEAIAELEERLPGAFAVKKNSGKSSNTYSIAKQVDWPEDLINDLRWNSGRRHVHIKRVPTKPRSKPNPRPWKSSSVSTCETQPSVPTCETHSVSTYETHSVPTCETLGAVSVPHVKTPYGNNSGSGSGSGSGSVEKSITGSERAVVNSHDNAYNGTRPQKRPDSSAADALPEVHDVPTRCHTCERELTPGQGRMDGGKLFCGFDCLGKHLEEPVKDLWAGVDSDGGAK